ncbi:MAG: ankyrin repeat domain-containing protein, partial [Planctomycetaceae bacterium]|nr:ankyrin repeat domain-containing protein [Planctomycetaceae bacterium]
MSSDSAESQEPDYSDTLAFLAERNQDMICDQKRINESKRWQIEKHLKHLSDDTKKFIFAVACNDFQTADKLFDKADLNAVDKNGNSAILYYTNITQDNLSTRKISWMIDKGINFDKLYYVGIVMGEPKYETFIEYISWDPIPLLLYLNRFPEKVNLANPQSGQTALGYAARYDRIESIRLLLSYGADPNLPDTCGKTPFLQAIIGKHYEIAILMTGYGVKTNIDFSFRSKKYHSILDFLLYGPYSRRDEESYKEETLKSIRERQNEPLKQALILLIQKQNTSCGCSQISNTKMKSEMIPSKKCIKKYSRRT